MKITKARPAIRLSITPEVGKALGRAKKLYPTLSDPEILKLGLSRITTSNQLDEDEKELEEIRQTAAYAVGYEYLSDPVEDSYAQELLKKAKTK